MLTLIAAQGGMGGHAAPGQESLSWGNIDCLDNVAIGDAQKLALHVIGLPITQGLGCPLLGDSVSVSGSERTWGDIDCGGQVGVGDAQKVARHLVGLAVAQALGCPAIGSGTSPGPEVVVEVTTDKDSHAAGESVPITVAVTNTSATTVELSYRDSQRFDVVITDGGLREVWRWSHGLAFTQLGATVPLRPGESLTFQVSGGWSQRDNRGDAVPRGAYYVFGISSHCLAGGCGLSSQGLAIQLP